MQQPRGGKGPSILFFPSTCVPVQERCLWTEIFLEQPGFVACQKYICKWDVALELSHSPARVSHGRGELPGLQAGAVPCTAAWPPCPTHCSGFTRPSLAIFVSHKYALAYTAGNIRDFCHNLPLCPGQDFTGKYCLKKTKSILTYGGVLCLLFLPCI